MSYPFNRVKSYFKRVSDLFVLESVTFSFLANNSDTKEGLEFIL